MTTATTNQVRIERIFDCPVDMLWKIWTDPDLLIRWHGGDANGKGISAEVDLRVGGRQQVRFIDSSGPEHMFFGEFTLVETNRKLAYSFEWEGEPGHVSSVVVDFFAMGDKTRIIMTHSNLNPASGHTYEKGWNGAFGKIDGLIRLSR